MNIIQYLKKKIMELSTFWKCMPTLFFETIQYPMSLQHPKCVSLVRRGELGFRNITISNLKNIQHVELTANTLPIWSYHVHSNDVDLNNCLNTYVCSDVLFLIHQYLDNDSITIDLFTEWNILSSLHLQYTQIYLFFHYKTLPKESIDLPIIHADHVLDRWKCFAFESYRYDDLRNNFYNFSYGYPLYLITDHCDLVFDEGLVTWSRSYTHRDKSQVPAHVQELVQKIITQRTTL
jgi:hypothetical protein